MTECKTAFRCGKISIQEQFKSGNIYILLFLVYCIIWYTYSGVSKSLYQTRDCVNIWELYIWFLSSRFSQLLYIIMILCFGYQAISIQCGNTYTIFRSNKKAWVLGRVLHLLFNVILLNLVILFSTWSICGWRIGISGEWSKAAMTASQFYVEKVGMRTLVYIPTGVLRTNPNMAGTIQFLLSVLAGMFSGMLLLVFSLANRAAYGVSIIFGIWYLDILISEEPILGILEYASPYGLARIGRSTLNYGFFSTNYALMGLALMCAVMMEMSMILCEKTDFVKIG